MSTKEPLISTKEPFISTKEPFISTKEPFISTKEPMHLVRIYSFHIYKRTDVSFVEILCGYTLFTYTKERCRYSSRECLQKNPVYPEKSPVNLPKSPTYPPTSYFNVFFQSTSVRGNRALLQIYRLFHRYMHLPALL